MYLTEFLKRAKQSDRQTIKDLVTVEYRLVCSGTLFNHNVITADWSKSEAYGVLLSEPFELTVASLPLDDYPQELCLRFTTPYENVYKERVSLTFLPDFAISQELSSLLTLIFRRLVTVAAKVREMNESENERSSIMSRDRPIPFTGSTNVVKWRRRPASILYGVDGVKDVIDYHPPPVGMDPNVLKKLLFAIPDFKHAEVIITSAKLYTTALEMIETRPEISYQLLISCAEVMANAVLESFEPNHEEMIGTKPSVYNLAKELGLSDEKAKDLVVAACQGNPWSKRKFKKFLSDNVTEELWTKDTLFMAPEELLPKMKNFDDSLNKIYDMRSGVTHRGDPYPISAKIGTSSKLPVEIMFDAFNPGAVFPPVTWFERVVSIAICNFIKQETGVGGDFVKDNG